MALSLRKQLEKAEVAREKAQDAVYASESTGRVVFSECLKMAPEETRQAYLSAFDKVAELRQQCVHAGIGYFDGACRFSFYR